MWVDLREILTLEESQGIGGNSLWGRDWMFEWVWLVSQLAETMFIKGDGKFMAKSTRNILRVKSSVEHKVG